MEETKGAPPAKRARHGLPGVSSDWDNGAAAATALREFFSLHRDNDWFRSMYHPEKLRAKASAIREECLRLQKKYFRDMLQSIFPEDPEWQKEDTEEEWLHCATNLFARLIELEPDKLQSELCKVVEPVVHA